VELPDNKDHKWDWLLKVAIASLPAIATVLIGMYVQTQQLLAAFSALDKDVAALKVEVSQIQKQYVSREELSRTIELINSKKR